MEVNQPRQRRNRRLCQTHNCTVNASATCLTDQVVVCNLCTAVFHYDCDVNIKDGEGFIYHTLETLKDLVETMKDTGMRTRINRIKIDFMEEIIHIQDNIKALKDKVERNPIGSKNVDKFVSKTKKLAKSIMESHLYSLYTDYIAKLKICEIVPNKLDDSGEMGIYGIRTQFYLDAKKKEMEFKENKLKALAQEMDTRVTQQAAYAKAGIEELKQLMFSMFEEVKEEYRSKLDEINSRLDRLKKKDSKSQKQHEKLKSNLDEHKQKIDNIEEKQKNVEEDMNVANIKTKERQTKQDEKSEELSKKIDDLAILSNKSMKKINSSIEVISQNIESSSNNLKREFESKIEETKSSLQQELGKKQKECSKLVEEYSEEFKTKYSELKQTVDTIQEDLAPVTEILDNQIQDNKNKKIEKIEKEKREKILKQLSLKNDQFYIEKLKLDSDKAKKFKEDFTKVSGVYKRLGEFDYGQPSCTTDHITTCIEKDNKWIYIGEVKEGTDDTPHGIGIRVFNFGTINEGYWKDGKQDGRGRRIRNDCEYYIGVLEGDNYNGKGTYYNCKGNKKYEGGWKNDKYNGQGTLYSSNGDKEYEGGWENGRYNGQGTRYNSWGDIEYEGGWKDGSRYGQGTLYTKNGDNYTGIWDGWYKGQGEVNYKDGTKYKGQWDRDYWNIKRHGLGTLYSADGQVLNQGKWEWDKYKGKE